MNLPKRARVLSRHTIRSEVFSTSVAKVDILVPELGIAIYRDEQLVVKLPHSPSSDMKHTLPCLTFLGDALLLKKKTGTIDFFVVIFTMAPNSMT